MPVTPLAAMVLGWFWAWSSMCWNMATPSKSLVSWLRQEHGVPASQHEQFIRVLNSFHFNPNNQLATVEGGWESLPALQGKLVCPKYALLPTGWASNQDPTLDAFKEDSLPFFSGFLDKLKAVMDPGLVGAMENPPGQQGNVVVSGITFFSTLFRWVSQGEEKDCNVCMPFNKKRVKAKQTGKYFSILPNGYLMVILGRGQTPRSNCKEYAHRLVCFLFNGPPLEGRGQVSHRCHNKECLNPSHLVWASSQENLAQVKRQPNEL